MANTNEQHLGDDRWHTSFMAKAEKRALHWMAPRFPGWVSPDMLTFLGLVGLIISGLAYAYSLHNWWCLIIASLGLAINWVGDSLDGTLARVRKKQRPKYGYYLDHLIDAVGVSCMVFGIAYSGLVRPYLAWIVLCLFFIASINTYLATTTLNVFKISYQRISTTEARVILIIMNTILIFAKTVTIFGFRFYWMDLIAILGALFLIVATTRSAYLCLSQLNREEKALWEKTDSR